MKKNHWAVFAVALLVLSFSVMTIPAHAAAMPDVQSQEQLVLLPNYLGLLQKSFYSLQNFLISQTPPAYADAPPPTPTITQPTDGATVSSPVTVMWNGTASPYIYTLWRNGTAVPGCTDLAYPSNQCPDSSASGLVTYNIAACSGLDNAGPCVSSNSVSVTVGGSGGGGGGGSDVQAPTTPTGIVASVVSPSQINLSWAASTDNVGVTGYKIYRGGTLWYTTANLSFSDTGLSSNTSYSYYVQAYDAAGNISSPSVAASATTQSGTASCSGLTLTLQNNKASYVQGETVTYTYVCSPGGTTSYVEVSLVKPDSSITVYNSGSGSISQNTMGFGTSNLLPGNYMLRACFTAGCSGGVTASAPFTVTGTTSIPPTPGTPTPASYSGWIGTSYTYTAILYPSPSGYQVKATFDWGDGTTSDTGYIAPSSGGTPVTAMHSWSASGVYSIKAKAVDTTNSLSSWSSVASMTVGTPPNSPNLISVTPSGSNVVMNWSESSSNVSGFKLYRKMTSPNISIQALPDAGATATSYTDINVPAGTYQYYLQAYNLSGGTYPIYSGTSNVVAITVGGVTSTDMTPPSTPTGLVATKDSYNEVDLSWTASTDNVGVAGYYINRSVSGVWSQIGSSQNSAYIDYTVAASTPYNYSVVARDAAGNRSATSTVLFLNTPAGSTAFCTILDLTLQNGKTAYVIGDYLTYTLSWTCPTGISSGTISVQLQSPDGSSMGFNSGSNNSPLTLTAGTSGLTPGTYILKACNSGVNSPCGTPAVSRTFTMSSSSGGSSTSTTSGDTTPPSTPTGVYVTSVGGSAINLYWSPSTDNVGVVGYKVYQNGVFLLNVASTLPTSVGNLNNLQSYTVAAYDAAGNLSGQSSSVSGASTPTSTISGVCLLRGPNVSVPIFSAADVGYQYAKMAKSGVNDIAGLRSACTTANYDYLLQQYCTQNTITNSTLAGQEVVTYTSSGGYSGSGGADGSGGSTYVQRASCPTTSTSTPTSASSSIPTAPSSLRQTGSGSNYIALAWNDNSNNEDKFNLERTSAGGSSWTFINQTGANYTGFTDYSVGGGTYYDYRIQACLSGYGCSTYAYVYSAAAYSSGTSTSTSTYTTCPSNIASLLGSGCHDMYGGYYFNTEMTQYVSYGGSTVNSCTSAWVSGCSGSASYSTSTGSGYSTSTTTTNYTCPAGQYWYAPSSGAGYCAYTSSQTPVVDIKVDGSDGNVYRTAPASYTLNWNTTGNPTSCVPTGTWGGGGVKSAFGSQSFAGVSVIGTKTYGLTCSNAYGSVTDTVTVEVTAAPSFVSTSSQATYNPFTTTTPTSAPQGGFVQGFVTDGSGQPLSSIYVHVFTENFSLNFSSITGANGSFGLNVPAGTYLVEISPPSTRTDLVRRAPQKFDVLNGEVKTLSLQFDAPSKTISGSVTFSSGEAVTDAEVGAYSSDSGQSRSVFTDGSGNFTLKVNNGTWQVSVHPRDPISAKWAWTGEIQQAVFGSGSGDEVRTVNFVILVSDAKLTVHALDQSGNVVQNAGIVVDSIGAGQKPTGADLPPPIFRKADGSGSADFLLKGGTYYVRAFLPSELGYFNPDEQQVVLVARQTKDVSLIFHKYETVANRLLLTGTTKLDDGTPTASFVWGWSESGDTVQVQSGENGAFSFPATVGRWHLGSGKEVNGFPYKSGELTVDVQSVTPSVDIVLAKMGTVKLPPPVTVSQSATQQIIAQAQDGAKVTIPEGGAQSSGNVNVEMKPTIEAPSQAAAKVVSTVYDVNITGDTGNAVTSLQKEIEITIPYNDEDLKKQGATEDTFVPSYYDETTGTWVKVDNYTIDKEKKVVIMRVQHLTRFALVAAADITPPDAPTGVWVTVGQPGEVIISWTNPTSDFSHVKVYRSSIAGELGKIAENNMTGNSTNDIEVTSGTKYYYTVRSVDPAGNESVNTTQVSITASGVFAGIKPPSGQATKAAILRTLQVGLSGDDVKALQELLLQEGVYPDGLVTGYFGNLTKQAVIQFQEKYASEILVPNGLTAGTGTVGPSTRNKMNQLLGGSATSSSAGESTPVVPPGQATGTILRTLQVGASGDDVKILQGLLIKEGFLSADSATGYFGNLTKTAVVQFQEKYASEILVPNGLTAGTGTVGPSTRAKLNQL
jgi:hypothetical protein